MFFVIILLIISHLIDDAGSLKFIRTTHLFQHSLFSAKKKLPDPVRNTKLKSTVSEEILDCQRHIDTVEKLGGIGSDICTSADLNFSALLLSILGHSIFIYSLFALNNFINQVRKKEYIEERSNNISSDITDENNFLTTNNNEVEVENNNKFLICPQCGGKKVFLKQKCDLCDGEGRILYYDYNKNLNLKTSNRFFLSDENSKHDYFENLLDLVTTENNDSDDSYNNDTDNNNDVDD
jgi:hypothetical protein